MRVILALAGDLEVLFRGSLGRLPSPVRAFLPARRLALRNPKFLLSLLEAARILDRLAFGVGKEHLEANVDANRGTIPLLQRFSDIADDEDVPMAVRPQHEMGGLGDTFERPMLFDLEAASELLGNSKPSGVGIEVQIPSTAVLPELYRMPAIGGLKAREADLPAKLFTVKKPLKGLIQSVGKGLYGGLRNVFAASTLESIG